jgi:hypothetical protein
MLEIHENGCNALLLETVILEMLLLSEIASATTGGGCIRLRFVLKNVLFYSLRALG